MPKLLISNEQMFEQKQLCLIFPNASIAEKKPGLSHKSTGYNQFVFSDDSTYVGVIQLLVLILINEALMHGKAIRHEIINQSS